MNATHHPRTLRRVPTALRPLVVALTSCVLVGSLFVTAEPAQAAGAETMQAAATAQSAAKRVPVRDRSTSAQGMAFVIEFEQLRQTPYNDNHKPTGGNCTVGYGHLIAKRPCTAAELKQTISRKRARAYLKQDLQTAEKALDQLAGRTPVTQAEFDALSSFVFNIGYGNFAGSKVLEDLRAKPVRYGSVPAHFKSFTRSGGVVLPGLVRRRNAEGNLFRTGIYSAYPQAG